MGSWDSQPDNKLRADREVGGGASVTKLPNVSNQPTSQFKVGCVKDMCDRSKHRGILGNKKFLSLLRTQAARTNCQEAGRVPIAVEGEQLNL